MRLVEVSVVPDGPQKRLEELKKSLVELEKANPEVSVSRSRFDLTPDNVRAQIDELQSKLVKVGDTLLVQGHQTNRVPHHPDWDDRVTFDHRAIIGRVRT
jgi:septal ring factor EnvC (AmiA/AmiB activator)